MFLQFRSNPVVPFVPDVLTRRMAKKGLTRSNSWDAFMQVVKNVLYTWDRALIALLEH